MHHRCLTRRFMTASIFSPLPKQNRAAIRAWLLISPATAVRQLSRFLHPTNRMQSHGAAGTMPGTEALGVTPGWHHGSVAHGDPPIPASRGMLRSWKVSPWTSRRVVCTASPWML